MRDLVQVNQYADEHENQQEAHPHPVAAATMENFIDAVTQECPEACMFIVICHENTRI